MSSQLQKTIKPTFEISRIDFSFVTDFYRLYDICKKEFLYNTLYGCFNFRIVRRILIVVIKNAEFVCFFFLPDIIVFYKFYSILNAIIC